MEQLYQSGIIYERTLEQQRDVFLSWERPDKAFFAAGGCHILAHLFSVMHQDEGFQIIHLQPRGEYSGSHMYASDGKWGFDFNGWTPAKELERVHIRAYQARYPEWEYDRFTVSIDWGQFINHLHQTHHRPPEFFPKLPWKRAYDYINQFPVHPPQGII